MQYLHLNLQYSSSKPNIYPRWVTNITLKRQRSLQNRFPTRKFALFVAPESKNIEMDELGWEI